MTLTQARQFARLFLPAAKKNVIGDTDVDAILRLGIVDVARFTKCLPTNDYIDVVVDKGEYNLSTELDDYLIIREPGVWFHSGGTRWKQLLPCTIKWLDEEIPTWRDADSDEPVYYYIEGDILGIHPKSATAYTNGLHVYFAKRPVSPTKDSHFLFGGANEITRLSILDDVVISYWEWQASKIVGDRKDILLAKRADYENLLVQKDILLKARPDIAASPDARLTGTSKR